jgi:hypothetical protein
MDRDMKENGFKINFMEKGNSSFQMEEHSIREVSLKGNTITLVI